MVGGGTSVERNSSKCPERCGHVSGLSCRLALIADSTYLLGMADLNQREQSRKRLLALLEGHQLSRALKQVRRQSEL